MKNVLKCILMAIGGLVIGLIGFLIGKKSK